MGTRIGRLGLAALSAVMLGLPMGAEADVASGLKAMEAENYDAARAAFQDAVDTGEAAGLYHLGAMHQAGLGVTKSETKALEYYRQAAEKGVAEAEFAIGLFYHRAMGGLLKNPGTAVDWYEKAAMKGSIGAQYNLAMMHATGEASELAYGSNPDYVKAYAWFSVVLESMETKYDKAHVSDRLTEIRKHLTEGQLARAEKEADDIRAKQQAQ